MVASGQAWMKTPSGLVCPGRGLWVPTPAEFVMDVTKPVAGNSGLSALGLTVDDLTVHEGNITVNTPGTVLERLLVRGQIKVNANNVTVRACKPVGTGTRFAAGVIETVGTGTVVEYCDLSQYDDTQWPPKDNSAAFSVGVQVGAGTALVRRNNIHDVDDGVTFYSGGTGEACGNYVHDMSFRTDDSDHASGSPAYWTHNDGFQLGAGVAPYIHGNNVEMTWSQVTGMGYLGYAMRNCHGMLLQSHTAVVTGLRLEYNWLSYGNFCVLFSSPPPNLSGADASLLGNRVTPNQALEYSRYTQIAVDPNTAWTLTGVDTTVYSDDPDTPIEWRGQPIKASTTDGTTTAWRFNALAHTP